MRLVIGEEAQVLGCLDASLIGMRGIVVLETMRMVTLKSQKRTVRFAKRGSAFQMRDGKVVIGDEMEGRLEDRIGGGSPV